MLKALGFVHLLASQLTKYICYIAYAIVFISMFAMVADLGFGVIARYGFKYSPAWYEDAARIFLVWLTFAGGVIAAERGDHVAIEIFSDNLNIHLRLLLRILVQCIILFTSFLILQYGWKFAMGGLLGIFPSMDWLPLISVYIAVPLGYAAIGIISIRNLLDIACKFFGFHHHA